LIADFLKDGPLLVSHLPSAYRPGDG